MSDRGRIILLLVGIGLVFVALHLALGGRSGRDWTRDHCSLSKNPWGTAGFRELLGQMDVSCESWEKPLTDLTNEVGVFVLLDPQQEIGEDERESLLSWVEGGGRLVLGAFGQTPGLVNMIDGRSMSPSGYVSVKELLGRLDLMLFGGESSGPGEVANASALTRGVSVVGVPNDWRVLITSPMVEDVAATGEARIDVAVGTGPVLVTVPVGQGAVHVLADVEVLSNAEMGDNDNAVLAANLVFAGGAPGHVYFDEYHHHPQVFGGPNLSAGTRVDSAPLKRTVLALLVVIAIYAAGRAQRFGAPVPPRDDQPRASSDYVRAFAEIYRRAEATGAAAQMLTEELRRKMARAARVAPSSSPDRLAEALTARGLSGQEMAALLTEVELGAREGTMTEAQLMRLAQRIAQYEGML